MFGNGGTVTDRAFDLELLDPSGGVVHARVEVDCRDWSEGGFRKTEVSLKVRWAGGAVSGVDRNYHASLCRVREQLARLGLTPRCYGACRNFVVSGMGMDMALGAKGYLVRLDQPVRMSDLVDIFQSGPEMDLASVADQAAFKEEWWRLFKQPG
jgi:hypothetical protein